MTDRKSSNANEEVDYDDLLSSAGKFGKYQWYLFFISGPFYLADVSVYFGQLFITEASPNHWCWIPELENLTAIERRTLAVPSDENSRFGYSQCSAYIANWTEVLLTGQHPNETWGVQPCQYGWEYNKTEIPYPTITSDLGWFCDKNSYQATAQSVFFLGSIVGGLIIGWISDRFGRIPAVTVSNMIGCFANIVSIYASDIVVFSVCRFIMGMSYDTCIMMAYLIVLEYVSPKYRSIITNLPFAIFLTLGATVIPWLALACNNWKIFCLVTSIPMAFCTFAPFILPESPRWLLSKNRVDDAIGKVKKIAKTNGKTIPPELIEDFQLSMKNKKDDDSCSFMEVFKRPLTRKVFICMCLLYMCCAIVFDALFRSIGSLSFDFFLSFTLVSFTELPSLIIVSFVLDLTGRKLMSVVTLSVCAVFCIVMIFIGGGVPSVLCAIAARFAVNMSSNAAMQWCAEIMPTGVRGTAASVVHICGYLATVISPYIVYLQNFVPWLPLAIIGVIALVGVVCSLPVPETAGRVMPQTFEDAENMILNTKLFDVPFLNKKVNR
ncbi:carcinine transporter-like [Colias croceus]|uniref:carcinine transporter-like n=1 Tax=Colias crocea TaxID=72248 RepID=UPI001E27CB13|nr:carcinine transporter-like [Colias croceus]